MKTLLEFKIFLKQLIRKLKLKSENEKQRYWRDFFRRNVDEREKLYFELYTDGKLRKGSALEYRFGLDELVNPNYEMYSLVKEIYELYIASYGGSDSASESSHYTNNLHVMAAITGCIKYKKFIKWKERWEKENGERFELKRQL